MPETLWSITDDITASNCTASNVGRDHGVNLKRFGNGRILLQI